MFAAASFWVFYHQLSEMRAEQRAWLSVNVVPKEMIVVRGRPPSAILEVTATNVGKSPARDVSYLPVVYVPTGPEQGGFSDLAKKNCPGFPMTGFAPILVPGDSYTKNLLIGFTRQQIVDAWNLPDQKGRKEFNALVIVCIAFRLTSEDDVHSLDVVTEIEQLTADKPATFDILGKYGD